MRNRFFPVLFLSLGLTLFAARAGAADGMVTGLSPDIDTLELYATPTAEAAALGVSAADLSLPTAILEVSTKFGMYRIRHGGTDYWVISDDVVSDVTREIDTSCDPKMAGTVVAHGKRGAGEGCQ